MPRFVAVLLGFAVLTLPAQASALCSYDGVLYLRPTIQREFGDAAHVVRARVVEEILSEQQPGATEDDLLWVAYRLRVVEDFKGSAPEHLTFYSLRNSGGFYLGAPGEEFLLFLDPSNSQEPGEPALATGAFFSNYCGHSKPWREVAAEDRAALARLSVRRTGS